MGLKRNIFIYHLDNELHKLTSLERFSRHDVMWHFESIIRLAFLLTDESVIIPFSNYMESQFSFQIMRKLWDLTEFHYGNITFVSTASNIDEILEKKEKQYGKETFNNFEYKSLTQDAPSLSFREKKVSPTKDIKKAWMSSVIDGDIIKKVIQDFPVGVPYSSMENALSRIPDRLEGNAFIAKNVINLLEFNSDDRKLEISTNSYITSQYIGSYLKEFNALCFKEIWYFNAEKILPQEYTDSFISFKNIRQKMHFVNYKDTPLDKYVFNCPIDELITFKNSDYWNNFLTNSLNILKEDANVSQEKELYTNRFEIKGNNNNIQVGDNNKNSSKYVHDESALSLQDIDRFLNLLNEIYEDDSVTISRKELVEVKSFSDSKDTNWMKIKSFLSNRSKECLIAISTAAGTQGFESLKNYVINFLQ